MLPSLGSAASGPDHEVRCNAVLSLEQIGDWTYKWLGCGIVSNPAWKARPQITEALAQAIANLPKTEPILAKRLQE